MKKPYGLTGSIGCGKSTVAGILEELGAVVYYCDAIAGELITDPAHREKIIEILGTDSPFKGASVDKKILAGIIFSDQQVKEKLEKYLHPLVWGAIEWRMAFVPSKAVVFVESALIYEIGWTNKFEAVLVVTCSEEEQVRRLRSIRGMNDLDISNRMYSQLSSREKESRADTVISTECSRESLEAEVKILYDKLKLFNQQEEE